MKHVSFILVVCLTGMSFGEIPVEEYSEDNSSSARVLTQISKKGADDLQTRFLAFCDLAVVEFNKEITRFADRDNADPATHHMPFFEDAHAARALAVAYDMTGEAKYLESVKAFAKLVMENYVGSEGCISNGLWPTYDGQWWCSTAAFGMMAFVLYEETGEKKYLKVAKGALYWMTHQDFREVKPITFQQRPSGIIFYCFEFYATGLKYLRPGSRRYKRAISRIDLAADWMARNQKTRGADVPDYLVKNVDMAGLLLESLLSIERSPRRSIWSASHLPRLCPTHQAL
ncbi:MAG: hypothetical protein H8E73_10325 [Planctomycetes bacterium]|nr:hypothetical protein [Planctomycetota bacterium]